MVKVGADLTDLDKSMKAMSKSLKNTGKEISSAGASLAKGITLPIAGALTASIKYASDLTESTNKVDVAFKGSAGEVKNWSKTTLKSFGIAKGTALDMASLFGDMGTAMGQTPKEAASMSESLVGLAGDLASFKNIGVDQAQDALKGIFTGEGESLKTLGVVMQDSTLQAYAQANGYKKSYSEMSQSEKVALRYAYVMDATKNAQGDFANTSSGTANQLRIVQESLKQLAATMGENLLPVINPILQKINEWVEKFSSLDKGTQNFIIKAALMAAAVGPIMLVIGKLTTGLGGVIGAFSNASKALSAGKGFMGALTALVGPAGIVLLVIAAVAVAAYLIIKYWTPISNFFTGLWNSVVGIFSSAWQGITSFFSSMWQGLKAFFSRWGLEILAVLVPFIGVPLLIIKHWDGIKQGLANIWNAIKVSASEKFNAIKNNIISAFNGVKTGVLNVWHGITSGIKGAINFIIRGINLMISGLNKVKFKVPDWVPIVGGKSFGINIPKVPALAKGGIVNRPTLAMIGEAGNEAVMPLDKIPDILKNTMGDAIQKVEHSGTITVNGVNNKGELVAVVEQAITNKIVSDNRRIPNRTQLLPIG
jgi:hypothetical protein